MRAFSLVGVDGNAFSIMGYTARALKTAKMHSEIDEMHKRAMAGDYNNLICVCDEYIQKVNSALGLEDYDDYDDED